MHGRGSTARRRYGQHFLKSGATASRIVRMADIRKGETVLEVGTGRGMLTGLLCKKAEHVTSIESDMRLYSEAADTLRAENLTLIHGDGFCHTGKFDVFVSNLPYSQSRRAIQWLAAADFRAGVIMVQADMFKKMTGHGHARRAVSVVWQHAFEDIESFVVGPHNFDPPPLVDSVVVKFLKRRTITRHTIHAIHGLFSQRRKIIRTENGPVRLDDMTCDEIMAIPHMRDT